MKLYCFWQSSCSWRARLGFAFKGVSYEYRAVNLTDGRASEEYRKVNPIGYVPVLEAEDGTVICDSIAILEYLEERFPDKPLLPKDLIKRATARQAPCFVLFCFFLFMFLHKFSSVFWIQIVNLIASGIQPLQNLGPRVAIREKLGEEEELRWSQHWIKHGFKALEEILKRTAGKYCIGDVVTMADIVLVPQVANAARFKVSMADFPTINRVHDELYKLPEVQNSVPKNQPDAPKDK